MADSSQYLIDIAAEIRGADSAASQLSALANELQAAGEAAQMAADDLADRESLYSQLEKSALSAAKAVQLAALKGPVPDDLKAKADQAAAALRGEAHAIDELRLKANSAAEAQKKLAAEFKKQSSLRDASQEAAKGSGNIKKLAGALNDLGGGPLTRTGSQLIQFVDGFGDFKEVLGAGVGGPVAIVIALTAAVLALGVAMAAGLVHVAAWAVGLADARRETELNVEALEADTEALQGLSDALPRLTRMTGLSAAELGKLGKQLAAAKISAEDMPAALEAIGMVQFAGGDTAKWINELKSGKKTVEQLRAEVDKKFGGIVSKRLIGLTALSNKFKANLGETFGGLEIESLLRQLSKLVDLFDQNTAAGKTIKFLFETIFQPIINGAAKALLLLEALFIGIAIGALQAYIAFKPLIKVISQALGEPDFELKDALDIAVFLGRSLVAGFLAVVAVLALVTAAFAAPLIAVAALGGAVAALALRIKEGITGAINFLRSVSLADIGRMMIEGLAGGIRGAAGSVLSALTGVVKGAINSAKSLLGIASPSKVFEGLGDMTAQGFAEGVEGGERQTQTALGAMTAAPATAGAPTTAAAGASIQIGTLTLALPGVQNAQQFAAELPGLLTRLLEGDVAAMGGATT